MAIGGAIFLLVAGIGLALIGVASLIGAHKPLIRIGIKSRYRGIVSLLLGVVFGMTGLYLIQPPPREPHLAGPALKIPAKEELPPFEVAGKTVADGWATVDIKTSALDQAMPISLYLIDTMKREQTYNTISLIFYKTESQDVKEAAVHRIEWTQLQGIVQHF